MIILNVLTVNRKWLDGWALLVIPGKRMGMLMDNVLERRKERLDDLLVDVAELRELVGKLESDNVKLRELLNWCKRTVNNKHFRSALTDKLRDLDSPPPK